MSHQSGIQVSEELSKLFADAVASGETRIIRVSIEKESLIPSGTSPVESSFEQDYPNVEKELADNKPSYVFVRLDEKASSSGEYKWLFLCYVPDNAKVRDKMLYASTRATLTKELGDYRFVDNIYGTEKAEFTLEGYKKHLKHKEAEAPLTRREQELAEIKAAEAKVVSDYQGTTTRKAYAPGVSFPLTEKAKEALVELTKPKEERTSNFVSLHLDSEKVDLDNVANVETKELAKTISSNAPRFTFYIFEQSNGIESLIFIYTCPSTSKIRERMLYSASKLNVISGAEEEVSLKVIKKFETSDLSDLTEDYFAEDLTPSSAGGGSGASTPGSVSSGSMVGDRIQMLGGTRQGFKRPVAPGRRRPNLTPNSSE
ncbi:actin depolymerizing protein [Backusella circina FSU 941]|nr:actin depolymerizing protein [Backusella circina FSU 941]